MSTCLQYDADKMDAYNYQVEERSIAWTFLFEQYFKNVFFGKVLASQIFANSGLSCK